MRRTTNATLAQGTPTIPLTFGEKMFAGAMARLVSQTVLHPVDVIRTRQQAVGLTVSLNASIFTKGILPQSLLSIPAGAIQFLTFETANDALNTLLPAESLNTARTLLAGALSAALAASVRIPQELLKQRIQADVYPNVLAALRQTLGRHGARSLYRGGVATLARDIPWNGLSFMFHAQAKTLFARTAGRPPATDENLLLAGAAGALSAVLMTPIDVVKTRIMTSERASAGVLATLRSIVREEGAPTLMKGVIPRVIFLAPLAGITFSVYEAFAAHFRKNKANALKSAAPTKFDPASLPRRLAHHPVRLARSPHPPFLSDFSPPDALCVLPARCLRFGFLGV